jgi:hypothetical protein
MEIIDHSWHSLEFETCFPKCKGWFQFLKKVYNNEFIDQIKPSRLHKSFNREISLFYRLQDICLLQMNAPQ